jgi:hypothetical protein
LLEHVIDGELQMLWPPPHSEGTAGVAPIVAGVRNGNDNEAGACERFGTVDVAAEITAGPM